MTRRADEPESTDSVRRFLASRGVSAKLRGKDLHGLVAEWDALASRAEYYHLTLDDWLNDLDLRDIIAGAMAVAPEHERVAARTIVERADEHFRRATVASPRPLLPDVDRVTQWWYLRQPARPGSALRDELIAAGFLARG